jgi:hypothetical protein
MATIDPVSQPWWTRNTVIRRVSIGVVVTLVGVIATYCQSSKSFDEKLDFGVKVSFGASALVALIVSYQTLRNNIYREQVKGTYEFLARYNTETERERRDKLRAIFKFTGDLKNIRDEEISELRIQGFMASLKPEDEKAAASLMSLFEDMALAIRSGYANESTTYRSLGPVTLYYISALRPYIFHIQQSRGDKVYFEDALLLRKYWMRKESFKGKLEK